MHVMSDREAVEAKKELPADFFFEGHLIYVSNGKGKGTSRQ